MPPSGASGHSFAAQRALQGVELFDPLEWHLGYSTSVGGKQWRILGLEIPGFA